MSYTSMLHIAGIVIVIIALFTASPIWGLFGLLSTRLTLTLDGWEI